MALSEILQLQICHAEDATSTTGIINSINDNFVNNINTSWDFWIWLLGIGIFIWLMGILGGGLLSFLKSIFGFKGRKY